MSQDAATAPPPTAIRSPGNAAGTGRALDARALYAALAGLCASLVAIGLARFAYTPLIPPLIDAHWFTAADTVTLSVHYKHQQTSPILGIVITFYRIPKTVTTT